MARQYIFVQAVFRLGSLQCFQGMVSAFLRLPRSSVVIARIGTAVPRTQQEIRVSYALAGRRVTLYMRFRCISTNTNLPLIAVTWDT